MNPARGRGALTLRTIGWPACSRAMRMFSFRFFKPEPNPEGPGPGGGVTAKTVALAAGAAGTLCLLFQQ